jgi:quercetin dioxygenase-like cupin family protein
VKGDIILVPAGTPHWFKSVSSQVTYYVVKIVKP